MKAKKLAVELRQSLEALVQEVNEGDSILHCNKEEGMEVDDETPSTKFNCKAQAQSSHTSHKTPVEAYSAGCRLEELKRECSKVEAGSEEEEGGRFEWVDSLLVKCLKLGHWMLLDNINLCR